MHIIEDKRKINHILKNHLSSIPSYSYERSTVYNFSLLHKSNGFLISDYGNFLAFFVEDYAGKSFHALFIIKPYERISTIQLEEVISFLLFNKEQVSHFFIKNLESNIEIKFSNSDFCSIPISEAYKTYRSKLYQLESNFGQPILCLKNFYEQKDLFDCTDKLNELHIPLLKGGQFSIFRYNVNRISRKFPYLSIKNNPSFYELTSITESWGEEMRKRIKSDVLEINEFQYNSFSYENYWYKPIISFLEYALYPANKFKFITRSLKSGINRGFWLGFREKNSLIVFLFVSNRKTTLFADAILLDIIRYAVYEGLDYINLGGSEDISLFKFKSKYNKMFQGSFIRKTKDIFIMAKR